MQSETASEDNKKLTDQIWSACKGDVTNKISKRTFKIVLFAIYNLWQPKFMQRDF